jgi:hypothetical protein
VPAGLACQVVALGEHPAPPWRKCKAKGAGKEVVYLDGELSKGARYLGQGHGIGCLPCLDNARYTT